MRVPSTDGVELELHDLGGDGPPLLLAHATGFCAQAYLPMAAGLTDRFHVWGIDFRAHGDTSTPEGTGLFWDGMTDDVLACVDALGGGPLVAFGHSMGGACLMAAERRRPGTLAAAYLFEPIIVPSGFGDSSVSNPLSASARRRRPTFPSKPEALARYASRRPLGTFRADALYAYVEHGFTELPDGSVTLKCRPEDEAATFEADPKPLIAEMGDVAAPTLVAYGSRDPYPGPAAFAPPLAEILPQGEAREYVRLDHFGPFVEPDLIAEDTAAFLSGR